MDSTFRFAVLEDLPQIVAIYNKTIPSRMVTADLEPVSIESRLPWFKKHSSEKYPLWVIEVEGSITGWFSLSPFKERAAYDHTAEISIYLDKNVQGKGLGHKSLSFLEQQLAYYPFKTIVALVFGHNLVSQNLFAKNGYVMWGRLPNVATLDGINRDLLFLGKQFE